MGSALGMRCAGLFAFAALAIVGFACADTSEPSQGEFTTWLKYMSDTSDNDAVDDVAPVAEADTVTGTWTGGDLYNLDKDHGDEAKKPKVNRDSIGVLPKPTGKPKKVVVSQDGKGDFKTINEALDSIPLKSTHRTIIHIRAGVYKYATRIPVLAANVQTCSPFIVLFCEVVLMEVHQCPWLYGDADRSGKRL